MTATDLILGTLVGTAILVASMWLTLSIPPVPVWP